MSADPSNPAIVRAVATGRAAHPSLAVEDATARAFFAARVADGGEPPEGDLAADLYLACAASAGVPAAHRAVEERLVPVARAALSRIVGPAGVDDALQLLREKLFLAAGDAPPRIAEYRGKGSLGAWLRVVAARTALSLRRDAARRDGRRDDDFLIAELPADGHPELDHLRERYRPAFRAAVVAALGALSVRERTLLRLHVLDGLTVDEIGAIYGVHRATAARWIARARASLFDDTRRRLEDELGLATAELESLVRLVQSQIDLSLPRLLAD
jgi:RNA polymerase sigma-70 factor (ECF subfamily)